MCAILQLVSAPLNPIPIAKHFRRSHPQCEHSYRQHIYMSKENIFVCLFCVCLEAAQRYITLVYVKYAETQPYSDLCISIQFSSPMVFSYRHGQIRRFVVRFVPEQTIRFLPVQ